MFPKEASCVDHSLILTDDVGLPTNETDQEQFLWILFSCAKERIKMKLFYTFISFLQSF